MIFLTPGALGGLIQLVPMPPDDQTIKQMLSLSDYHSGHI